ncbi:glycoside hydrolase family 17 protein [Serendipita vermifera MAFF 305830]|uniref:glucan endo-1,3-beta-D-glucosidase n=1 Tax=Serendipita vermifera MAFF 305830 TaxID=933852 RepID=A0A0C2XM67_SERVB|nr:glycoside hydrolase family 17 protein [Serendipita vermifera MAFF 305830]
MRGLHLLLTTVFTLLQLTVSLPLVSTSDNGIEARATKKFPDIGYQPPALKNGKPSVSLSNWWSPLNDERGFLGFTYYTEWCQDYNTLESEFRQMRNNYNARYVRMYSWCDDDGTYINNFIQAAYSAGLGVYATIWFGFDGDDKWIGRRDLLVRIIKTNPLAPYVIRTVDVGSEPLYDWVLEPQQLADQIYYVKSLIGSYGIKVSISEMQYGYSVQGNSDMVLDAEDVVHAHQLPYFDNDARSGSDAKPSLVSSTDWFKSKTGGNRKIIFTQTGWPTNANVWGPNSPNAVASVDSAKAFAKLLDGMCETFKSTTPGGVGWFWHIWSDAMLDGWGLLDWNGNPKWNFAPRTSC